MYFFFSFLTELYFSRWAAQGAPSRPGGVLHSPHGPLHWPRRCARSPGLHVILYRSVWRERPLNTLSSVVLTRDHQPTCSDHRHVLQQPLHPTPVLLRSFFGCLWPYLFVTILRLLLFVLLLFPPLQPLRCSLTLCLRCICFPRNAAALQVYKEGERKMFLFLFSCCHCFSS